LSAIALFDSSKVRLEFEFLGFELDLNILWTASSRLFAFFIRDVGQLLLLLITE
jgi:hypothetical protein